MNHINTWLVRSLTCLFRLYDILGDRQVFNNHHLAHYEVLFDPFSLRPSEGASISLLPIGITETKKYIEYAPGSGFDRVLPEFHGHFSDSIALVPGFCPTCVFDEKLPMYMQMHQWVHLLFPIHLFLTVLALDSATSSALCNISITFIGHIFLILKISVLSPPVVITVSPNKNSYFIWSNFIVYRLPVWVNITGLNVFSFPLLTWKQSNIRGGRNQRASGVLGVLARSTTSTNICKGHKIVRKQGDALGLGSTLSLPMVNMVLFSFGLLHCQYMFHFSALIWYIHLTFI